MDSWEFRGMMEHDDKNLYANHIVVPGSIVKEIKAKKINRLLCSINGGDTFNASLIPKGDQVYFIKVNSKLRKQYDAYIGSNVSIQLTKDESKYGMPMPEEFQEILDSDPVGNHLFHTLTPGKQRSLLHLIGKVKSVDKRIEKGLIILEHLQSQNGKLDFKILNSAFKEGFHL